MSFAKDLDEYTDAEIVAEYQRRLNLGQAGFCTYCQKHSRDCNCRMKGRPGWFRLVLPCAGSHSIMYHL